MPMFRLTPPPPPPPPRKGEHGMKFCRTDRKQRQWRRRQQQQQTVSSMSPCSFWCTACMWDITVPVCYSAVECTILHSVSLCTITLAKTIETAESHDVERTLFDVLDHECRTKIVFSGCALGAERSRSSAVSHYQTASYWRHDSRLSKFFGQGSTRR